MTSSTKHKTGGFGGAGTGYMQVRVCFDFERDGLFFLSDYSDTNAPLDLSQAAPRQSNVACPIFCDFCPLCRLGSVARFTMKQSTDETC